MFLAERIHSAGTLLLYKKFVDLCINFAFWGLIENKCDIRIMCSEMKYQKCNKIINAFMMDSVNIIERQFTDVQLVICGDKI